MSRITEAEKSSKHGDKRKRPCTVCGKRFQKPSQLERHLRIHTGEKPYKCMQCGKSFNQKVTLDNHIQSQHDKVRPFVCQLCKCTFSQRGNWRAHLKNVHVTLKENEKAFRCEECDCVFRRLATLNSHISKAHAVEKPVADSYMDNGDGNDDPSGPPRKEAPSEQQVKFVQEEEGVAKVHLVHVKKVGGIRVHVCNHCPKSFKKPSDLIRHVRTHTLEKPFKCRMCFKAFAIKTTLNTHMQTHEEDNKWRCHSCSKTFSLLSTLKNHRRLHGCLRVYKCLEENCEKSFKTSAQRRSHLRLHHSGILGLNGRRKLLQIGETEKSRSEVEHEIPDALKITERGLVPVPLRPSGSQVGNEDSRPHRCPQCSSSFKKSSHLKQHLLTHSGEKPFQCLQCQRRFVSSGVLKNHIRIHGGIRPYKCEICLASFTTRGSLRRHTFIHSSSRPYLCPVCKKSFKTNVSCRKHIKIHVKDKDKINSNVKLEESRVSVSSIQAKEKMDGAVWSYDGCSMLLQHGRLETQDLQTNAEFENFKEERVVLPSLMQNFVLSAADNVACENSDYWQLDASQNQFVGYSIEIENNPTPMGGQQENVPIQKVVISQDSKITSFLPPNFTNVEISFQDEASASTAAPSFCNTTS